MSVQQTKRTKFFFYYASIILLTVVGGFGTHAVLKPANLPPASSAVLFHATFMFAWYVLFVIQSGLIPSGRHDLHMRLGKMSLLVALGIIISGIMVTFVHYFRKPEGLVFISGFINVINFGILYGLAVLWRKHPAWHKRLMLFAGLAMMGPALTRIVRAADINEFAVLLMWLFMMLIPVLYDFTSIKKVHKATLLGIALILVGIILMVNVGMSPAWERFLANRLG